MKKQLVSLFFVLTFSGSLYAQSYTDIVWTQIQEGYDTISDLGFSVTNYIIGSIKEDDDNIWTFYLSSDKEYLIQAYCDEDCNDLDLYLRDEDGDVIVKDTEDDDFPLVSFEPNTSGRYQIKVSMFACEIEPCYFGLAIFEK